MYLGFHIVFRCTEAKYCHDIALCLFTIRYGVMTSTTAVPSKCKYSS